MNVKFAAWTIVKIWNKSTVGRGARRSCMDSRSRLKTGMYCNKERARQNIMSGAQSGWWRYQDRGNAGDETAKQVQEVGMRL